MGTYEPTATRGWRGRAVRRLQRLADSLDPDDQVQDAELVETEDVDDEVDEIEAVDVFDHERRVALAAERATAARRAEFRAVVKEVYPSVAPAVIALAEGGCDADLDEWLTVSRLLYDDLTHRDGGLSAEARERALRAAAAQALEAQARSSARLAGYTDAQQDELSTIKGDPAGTLVWEHYLCREAKLVRENLHGETLGHWLAALGELWSAASQLYRLDSDALLHVEPDAELVEEPAPPASRPSEQVSAAEGVPGAELVAAPAVDVDMTGTQASSGSGTRTGIGTGRGAVAAAERERARIALKAALARVEELALW
jgi:hypothetical protein